MFRIEEPIDTDENWVPGYFIDRQCLGSGFKDELNIFEKYKCNLKK